MMRSPRIRHVKVTNNKLRESIDRSRKNEDSWVLWESRNTEIKYCPFCGADCEIVEGSLGFQVVCMGEKKHSLNRFSKQRKKLFVNGTVDLSGINFPNMFTLFTRWIRQITG